MPRGSSAMLMTIARILAAALSGVTLVVVAPPINQAWLHWICFVPLLWALRADPPHQAPAPRRWYGVLPLVWELKEKSNRFNTFLGFVFGFASEFAIYWWLVDTVQRFSNFPTWLGVLVLVIFSLAHAIPFALVFGLVQPLRRHLGRAWLLVVPALLVVTEWLFPAQFPYQQGATQYRELWIFQIVSVTGVWGLSYLLVLVNCTLAEWLYRWRDGRRPWPWRVSVAVAVIFLLNLGFGAWRHGRIERALQQDARDLKVAILQQNITMMERYSQLPEEVVRGWFAHTRKLKGQRMDLVVWPEGSSPYNPHEGNMLKALGRMVQQGEFELLIGGGTNEITRDPATGEPGIVFHNSVYMMDRQGEITGRYDKLVPLPFGEYIPLAQTFPILKRWIQGPGDFRAGTEVVLLPADGYTIAAPICYEAIKPAIVQRMKGADLLVNVTNDAWFGHSAAAWEHAMLAAVRSTELGRPMLRIAYSGISMIVEPHGEIPYETPIFEDVAEVRSLRLATFDTIYWRLGFWFPVLCLLGSLVALELAWRRSLRPPAPTHRFVAGG
jgi:apolipoprotein N-acyltransferase